MPSDGKRVSGYQQIFVELPIKNKYLLNCPFCRYILFGACHSLGYGLQVQSLQIQHDGKRKHV
jgi:hypothetical protein